MECLPWQIFSFFQASQNFCKQGSTEVYAAPSGQAHAYKSCQGQACTLSPYLKPTNPTQPQQNQLPRRIPIQFD